MGLGRGVVRAAVVQAAPAIMDRRGIGYSGDSFLPGEALTE